MTKKEIIKNYILKQIKEKKWKPGDKIFSKYQFSKYFNVSQNTAQTAVHELVNENILETRNGSGVYVPYISKKIIINTRESVLYYENSKFHRNCISYLKNKLKDLGFETQLNLEENLTKYDFFHTKDKRSEFNFEEIAGFISIMGSRSLIEYFAQNQIPVIDSIYSEYSSVVFDRGDFYMKILELTKKHLGSNPLFFEYIYENTEDIYSNYYFEKLSKKYNFALISYIDKNKKISSYINAFLEKIDFKPTGIVFTDDTLYVSALPLFEKYKNIFTDTNIITMSHNDEFYPEEYNICRIEYSVEERCDKICEILLNAINKKYTITPNYKLKYKIINENTLK